MKERIDFAFDVMTTVIIAFLLAFVVLVWQQSNGHVAAWVATMFFGAYQAGRWHSTRSWQRALRRAREDMENER